MKIKKTVLYGLTSALMLGSLMLGGASLAQSYPPAITPAQIPALPLKGGTIGTGTAGTGTTGTGTAATTTGTATATTTTTTTAAPATTAQTPATPAATTNSITALVNSTPELSTLAAALKAGNLEMTFDAPGDYTVFAPTNDAFAKVPQEQLDALLASPDALFEVLTNHVVAGRLPATDVTQQKSVTTLYGSELPVVANGSAVMVGTANVVKTDLTADNGVVHEIDSVLVPSDFTFPTAQAAPAAPATTTPAPAATTTAPAATTAAPAATATTATDTSSMTIAAIVTADPRFSTLLSALQAAGLADTLAGTGPFMVFAPTNDAFAKIPADQLQALLADKAALTRLLQYHVSAGSLMAAGALQARDINTLAGANLSVTQNGSAVMVNDATVVQPDIQASNGVIHAIDTVLVPPTP